jgi:hypothetical protein
MKNLLTIVLVLSALCISNAAYARWQQKVFFSTSPPSNALVGGSFVASAYATSELPIMFTTTTPSVISVVGDVVYFIGSGTAVLIAVQEGNVDWFPKSSSQTFTVSAGSQSISFNSLPSGAFYLDQLNVSASASSNLPVTYSVSGNGSLSGTTLSILAGSGYVYVTASQAGNASYLPASITQTIYLTPRVQSISYSTLLDNVFGGSASVSASAPGGQVTISVIGATLIGNTVFFTVAGSVSIIYSQAGQAGYWQPASASQTITVAKANQTISFTSLPSTVTAGSSLMLNASASSGLPITFNGSGPVSINSGGLASFYAVGIVYVSASQGGNGNYNAASQVMQTITVTGMGLMANPEQQASSNDDFIPVSAYPNPANREVTISLAEPTTAVLPFLIYNGTGAVVSRDQFEKGDQTKTLNTEELTPGVYIFRGTAINGVVRKKIMVVH